MRLNLWSLSNHSSVIKLKTAAGDIVFMFPGIPMPKTREEAVGHLMYSILIIYSAIIVSFKAKGSNCIYK